MPYYRQLRYENGETKETAFSALKVDDIVKLPNGTFMSDSDKATRFVAIVSKGTKGALTVENVKKPRGTLKVTYSGKVPKAGRRELQEDKKDKKDTGADLTPNQRELLALINADNEDKAGETLKSMKKAKSA